ncbi:MAG: tryptophan 7-halogenase [Verrucomicrobia bacterium]|nr:tryptophan 7-halogenase [Verrucomicrobiota bacterium]
MRRFDVAVIGGGPAGSVAGSVLAGHGRSVVILEKEKFPRFQVGESTIPASLETLHRIGVKEKIDQAGFLIKHGGEIVSACGSARAKFLFKNGLNPRWKSAYQIDRMTFDDILLKHAQGLGCDVQEGTAVESVDFTPSGVVLRCKNAGEALEAAYVIDCSGRTSFLANRFGLKQPFPHLKKFCVYSYFERAGHSNDPNDAFTRMIRAKDCWFWVIPIAEGRLSIGAVMDLDTFRAMKSSPEQVLARCIEEQPEVRQWVENTTRYLPVYATADFSYAVKRLFGDRWVLAGDAAGFIDPVFSSGIYIAIYSGEKAGDAVNSALADPAGRTNAFRRYERAVQKRFRSYLKLSSAWYTKEFIEIFLHPREVLNVVAIVNSVLGGNPPRTFQEKFGMSFFYLLVYLQGRTGKLVPQLGL